MPVLPGAEPYSHDGGDSASCSSTASPAAPQSLRPWAEHLAAAGYTVRVPRLPGHGTTWQEMNRTRWEDWYAAVDAAFRELHETLRVGLRRRAVDGRRRSSPRLAQEHGPRVRRADARQPGRTSSTTCRLAAAAGAPDGAAVAARHRQRHQAGRARTSWPTTASRCKALHSQTTAVVEGRARPARGHPAGAALALGRGPRRAHLELGAAARSASPARTSPRSCLHDSYHVATLDHDAPRIFEESVAVHRAADVTASPGLSRS